MKLTANIFKGDNHQHQLALTSRFEAALRQQQQQQQSRQVCNRRKAESICFSSTACLNSALLPSNNALKSHPLAVNIGQLGSPPPPSLPVDLCQPLSKSYANTPQKFSRVWYFNWLFIICFWCLYSYLFDYLRLKNRHHLSSCATFKFYLFFLKCRESLSPAHRSLLIQGKLCENKWTFALFPLPS